MPDDAYCIFSCDPTGLGENPCSWGCTDPTADNYDEEADIDDGSCVTEIPGCMDSSACNYNSSANIDDNSCTFAEYWCGTTYQCSEDSCPPIEGCMDTKAFNYMTVATKEPDESEYVGNIYRGIAYRKFERKFTIADDIIVKGASLENGMLMINLERIVPDEKKPRLITIN